MGPASYTINIYHGDSYYWTFTLWEDLTKTIPVDLTGCTAKAEIRSAPGGTQITSFVCTIIQPNQIKLTLSPTNSSLLPFTGGVWDLQITHANTDVTTVVAGFVKVVMDVTDTQPVPLGQTV
jgi:hypothetical protein